FAASIQAQPGLMQDFAGQLFGAETTRQTISKFIIFLDQQLPERQPGAGHEPPQSPVTSGGRGAMIMVTGCGIVPGGAGSMTRCSRILEITASRSERPVELNKIGCRTAPDGPIQNLSATR